MSNALHGKYHLEDYDRFFSLRPSWLMVATMVFLCRGWLLLLVMAASAMAGISIELSDISPTDHVWSGLIAGVPAALVLYCVWARRPDARGWVRSVWRNGRLLLAVSALLHVALTVASEGTRALRSISPLAVTVLLVDLWIVTYVVLSARVKDTFSDFPDR